MNQHPNLSAPPATHANKRHIVLIGLMGCGKSHVGKLLAERFLTCPFFDADLAICDHIGLSIPEIFSKHGEKFFRSLEGRLICEILKQQDSLILATGGGAFMNLEIRRAIKESGFSIWLKAETETLARRVSSNIAERPLLDPQNVHETITRLAQERHPVYAEADLAISTDFDPPQKVADKIYALMKPAMKTLTS